MSRRHRGVYHPRPYTLKGSVQVLHIPRSSAQSSTLLIEPNGTITPLPFLATPRWMNRRWFA